MKILLNVFELKTWGHKRSFLILWTPFYKLLWIEDNITAPGETICTGKDHAHRRYWHHSWFFSHQLIFLIVFLFIFSSEREKKLAEIVSVWVDLHEENLFKINCAVANKLIGLNWCTVWDKLWVNNDEKKHGTEFIKILSRIFSICFLDEPCKADNEERF